MNTLPPRDSYKALLWDYDYLLSKSDDECCYSLSEREVQILLAQVDYIAWKTRYKPTSTEIDLSTILGWQGKLARKLMSGCCPDEGKIFQYLPDGTLQSSTDGGVTWEDDPSADPRNSAPLAPQIPGAPSDSIRCAAANNVRDQYENMRDNTIALLTGGTTVLLLVAALVGAIGGILAISVVGVTFGVLLFSLAGALLSLTPESVAEQIDSAALNQFRCIVYCHMNESGRLESGGFDAILTDIASQFSGFPETFFYSITASLQEIGIENAATMGTASATDCGGCACSGEWCHEFNFLADDGDWEIRPGAPYGQWILGQGFVGTAAGSGVSVVASRTLSGFTINHIEYDVVFAGTGNAVIIIDNSVAVASFSDIPTGHYSWDGTVSGTDVTINPSSGAAQGADCAITWIRFAGTGTNPFGSNNCF